MGATPWNPKFDGSNRFWFTASIGLIHQSTIQVSSPPITIAARPTTASFTASQRRRVTLWVQERRKMPVSISRAISGAPKKSPMSAGAIITMSDSACCNGRSVPATGFVLAQACAALQVLLNVSFTVYEVGAGDCKHHTNGHEQNESNDPLCAELAQRQPDHDRTSSFGRRSCSTPRVI